MLYIVIIYFVLNLVNASFILTKISLKLPCEDLIFIPNKSFTCDVNTCMAAPVVNPETNTSDNKLEIMPIRKMYMPNFKSYNCNYLPTKKSSDFISPE